MKSASASEDIVVTAILPSSSGFEQPDRSKVVSRINATKNPASEIIFCIKPSLFGE
jgi:hypothetical protein